jgi:RNA polymerase sigma-70 factor (ECF subfamily)
MPGMTEPQAREAFNRVVLPALPAAHRLAMWLLRDPHAAEDVVQEAALRAWRNIASFRGANEPASERAWVLRIVRNLALTRLGVPQGAELPEDLADPTPSPETAAIRAQGTRRVNDALAGLPAALRECLALKELEGLSYREIADVVGIPVGTVMSRLWRARQAMLAMTEGFRL